MGGITRELLMGERKIRVMWTQKDIKVETQSVALTNPFVCKNETPGDLSGQATGWETITVHQLGHDLLGKVGQSKLQEEHKTDLSWLTVLLALIVHLEFS